MMADRGPDPHAHHQYEQPQKQGNRFTARLTGDGVEKPDGCNPGKEQNNTRHLPPRAEESKEHRKPVKRSWSHDFEEGAAGDGSFGHPLRAVYERAIIAHAVKKRGKWK